MTPEQREIFTKAFRAHNYTLVGWWMVEDRSFCILKEPPGLLHWLFGTTEDLDWLREDVRFMDLPLTKPTVGLEDYSGLKWIHLVHDRPNDLLATIISRFNEEYGARRIE